MKLYAYVGTDGRIRDLVAIPAGERNATLMKPQPGVVSELHEHGVTAVGEDLQELQQLRERFAVAVTKARGILTDRQAKR